MVVGDDLHLDVAGAGDHPLEEDGRVAERLQALGARAVERGRELRLARCTLRMPRPPPPDVALIISG